MNAMRSRPFTSSLLTAVRVGLAVGGATTGLLLVRTFLSTSTVALLYLLPVGFSAAFGGLWAGAGAAVLSFLAFNYFFIPPYYTFNVHQTQDLLALLVFLVVAVVMSQLMARAQTSLAHAQQREREATHLYELSNALAGLQDEHAIVHALAEHAQQTFGAEGVEVSLEPRGTAPSPITRVWPAGLLPKRPAEVRAPLQTARGLVGEIRLWRAQAMFSSGEERLLSTFASQGALALERARLAVAETRAKISEESDRLKSALLSSVSHELRTPLATVKAAVTSLRGGAVGWDTEARKDLLAALEEEADQLNRLVGNLLDMSRIEAGALHPQRQWNLLAEIVAGVIARMKRAARQHQLRVDLPEDLPLVPVDYVQMEQVFTNLISNSLKYAPPDTIIGLSARLRADDAVHVRVTNQGPPVPPEHLGRIFDKFYRVTEADRVTGTGLGLSICKGIVEAHGGRIWAENLRDGFAFNFTLPLTLDGQRPPASPMETEAL